MFAEQLSDFGGYIATPRLIAPTPLRDAWRRWAIMVGVYLGGLIVLAPLLTLWHHLADVPAAEAFKGYAPGVLIAGAVLAFPLAEEIAFRGWLTGRPRALWLLAMALAAAALLVAVTRDWHQQAASLMFLVTLAIAFAGWWLLRQRSEPPRWFAHKFAAWFYGSAVVFGLLHLSNYPRLSWALVPMVLPQVWAGLVFGYLRMHHGLWASALAHATGNAAVIATALLAGT
jgi:membrane protease YdiL (CAAX protease family)